MGRASKVWEGWEGKTDHLHVSANNVVFNFLMFSAFQTLKENVLFPRVLARYG